MRTINEQIKDVKHGLICCLASDGACLELNGKYYTDDLNVNCSGELCNDATQLIDNLLVFGKPTEGLWIYCPDDEDRPRWKCSRCGKIVHKDPAEKLYCALCGQRNRKEA